MPACCSCSRSQPKSSFAKSQLKKAADRRRCLDCAAAAAAALPAAASASAACRSSAVPAAATVTDDALPALASMNRKDRSANAEADAKPIADASTEEQARDGGTESEACATCGKTNSVLTTCIECESAKYCSGECKEKHRPTCAKLKRDLAVETALSALPPRPDCPICALPMPLDPREITFQSCCGKIICNGCTFAKTQQIIFDELEKDPEDRRSNSELVERMTTIGMRCAFCRELPGKNRRNDIEHMEIMVERGCAEGIYYFAKTLDSNQSRDQSDSAMPKDDAKALDLYRRSADLGFADALYSLAVFHQTGDLGVAIDKQKEKKYLELAAAGGHEDAILTLGRFDAESDDFDAAMCKARVAALRGSKGGVQMLYVGYEAGLITKQELADTLRAHQAAKNDCQSEERDAAIKFLSKHPRT